MEIKPNVLIISCIDPEEASMLKLFGQSIISLDKNANMYFCNDNNQNEILMYFNVKILEYNGLNLDVGYLCHPEYQN